MLQAASYRDTGCGAFLSVELHVCVVIFISSMRTIFSLPRSRSKIIENLAVVGYDTNNLHLAPYDWRLSFYNLEERDGYFSKLRATIEGFV